MKRNMFLLMVLAVITVGCTGAQEIVEPSRDNFNTGEVTTHTLGAQEG